LFKNVSERRSLKSENIVAADCAEEEEASLEDSNYVVYALGNLLQKARFPE
jgi:hypothetical protein